MRLWKLLLAAATTLVASGLLLASDDQLSPVRAGTAADERAPAESPDPPRDALLRLQSTGLTEQAARAILEARRAAASIDLLARKEAELERLLEDLDRLRNASGQPAQFDIHVTAFEVSPEELGCDVGTLDQLLGADDCDDADENADVAAAPPSHESRVKVLDDSPLRDATFQRMLDQKQITILSRPRLRATSRQASSMTAGPQVVSRQAAPARWETRPVGRRIRLEFLPVPLAAGRLRLQARFEADDFAAEDPASDSDEKAPEAVHRSLETTVEMRLGQTLALVQSVGERQIVLLATPRAADQSASNPSGIAAAGEANPALDELLPFVMEEDFQYFPVTPVRRRGTTP